MNSTLLGRARGALLGLAVGDAVGTSVEFCAPGSFAPLVDMIGGGPFRLEPGQWTDDTSMALCLAESLIVCEGFDARDQMERYVLWWREGHLSSTGSCFDIGGTVRGALGRYLQTREPFSGSNDEWSAANGSIMRIAPVPIFFHRDPDKAVQMSGESSRTTHALPICVAACRYLGALVVGALSGADRDELLDPAFPLVARLRRYGLHPAIEAIAAGSFRQKEPPEICGDGYVARSLEAALWAFSRSSTFREGCLLAANLGEDADTTAAIYGQIAGAFHADEGIPAAWLARLAMRDKIVRMATQLVEIDDPVRKPANGSAHVGARVFH
jgi:ADP-ribosyl-[dinitrogen reductase] hydrolase